MICKVRQAFEKYGMPVKGRRILAALSGGADSMAMLNVLLMLSGEYGFTVEACHVNHCIRGADADSDERFVREYCSGRGVKLHVLRADIPAMAAESGRGLEECGRQVRYDFFASVDSGALISTAHTLSDRCETLLINAARGSSLRGLRSIPPVRGNIIRPLIDCTRADIEAFCAENSIPFVTDKTNFDDSYSRNRIRLNVIPELKKLNPALEDAFLRLMEAACADDDHLEKTAAEAVKAAEIPGGYDAGLIAGLDTAVRRRAIAGIISRETGVQPELVHIKLVESVLGSGTVEIKGDTIIKVVNGRLKINPEKESSAEWEYDFSSLSASAPAGNFSGRIINRNELPSTQIVHNNVLDFDRITGGLTLRNRRAGDRMMMASSGCTKTLKKLFTEKHLENRNSLGILTDDLGIVWVEGLGCHDRCKITENTKRVLLITEVKK